MTKSSYRGSSVHRTIDGKKYYCLAWYPEKKHAVERAGTLRKKGMSVRVIKGAPWGYPKLKAYMVYVPDHTRQ